MDEEEINKQTKRRIMLHLKALGSKNEKVQYKAFKFLVNKFFDNPECIEIDELDFLDIYSVKLAMILSLTKGLMEEDDYNNLAIVRDIKQKISLEVCENITSSDELYEYELMEDYYTHTLHNILKL